MNVAILPRPLAVLVVVAASLSLATAQSPDAAADALADPDWRVRVRAANELESLAPESLPVARLLAISRTPELPVVEPPGLGGGAGGRAAVRDPAASLLLTPKSWIQRHASYTGDFSRRVTASDLERIAAPLSAQVLIAFVLRRATDPTATQRLVELLDDDDASIRYQAAKSLTDHGATGREALLSALASPMSRHPSLTALASSVDAERHVGEWLHRLTGRQQVILLHSAPRATRAFRRIVAREILVSQPDEHAADAVVEWAADHRGLSPFARDVLASDVPSHVHRALAAICTTSADTRSLVDAVLPLLSASAPRTALWAPQALAAMKLRDDDAVRAGAVVHELLRRDDTSRAQRFALLLALASLHPPAPESIAHFVEIARTGPSVERSAAFAALVEHRRTDALGDDLDTCLRACLTEAVKYPSSAPSGPVLRAAFERMPLDELSAALIVGGRSFRVPAAAERGFSDTPDLETRIATALEIDCAPLRHIAVHAALDCVRRGIRPLPNDLLDVGSTSAERLVERLGIVAQWTDMPEPVLRSLVGATAAANSAKAWDAVSLRLRHPAFAEALAAALRSDDEELASKCTELALRYSRDEPSTPIVLAWLDDAHPCVRRVAESWASDLRPLPQRVVARWYADLASDDVARRATALRAFANALHDDAVPWSSELDVRAQAAFDVPELREAATRVLVRGALR
jgi:hypothetical protein